MSRNVHTTSDQECHGAVTQHRIKRSPCAHTPSDQKSHGTVRQYKIKNVTERSHSIGSRVLRSGHTESGSTVCKAAPCVWGSTVCEATPCVRQHWRLRRCVGAGHSSRGGRYTASSVLRLPSLTPPGHLIAGMQHFTHSRQGFEHYCHWETQLPTEEQRRRAFSTGGGKGWHPQPKGCIRRLLKEILTVLASGSCKDRRRQGSPCNIFSSTYYAMGYGPGKGVQPLARGRRWTSNTSWEARPSKLPLATARGQEALLE